MRPDGPAWAPHWESWREPWVGSPSGLAMVALWLFSFLWNRLRRAPPLILNRGSFPVSCALPACRLPQADPSEIMQMAYRF